MKQYVLVTHWHLHAPIERVWDAIERVEDWPRWWKYVKAVVEIERGGGNGVGALRRYTWTSRLPYELSFEMRTTAAKKPVFLSAGEYFHAVRRSRRKSREIRVARLGQIQNHPWPFQKRGRL